MRTSRHAVAAAAVLALLAGACSTEADNDPVGQVGVTDEQATSPNATPSSEGGTTPSVDDGDIDISDGNSDVGPTETVTTPEPTPEPTLEPLDEEHEGDLAAEGEAELLLDVSEVDRTNPEEIVAAMLCTYYSSDGTETANEIVDRVAPLATDEAVGGMHQIRMTAFPGQVRLVAPLLTRQVADKLMYEQTCHVEVRDAESYEITRSPSTYKAMIGLEEQNDGTYLVSSFDLKQ